MTAKACPGGKGRNDLDGLVGAGN